MERLFPALEKHCQAGDAAAVTAVVRKSALAGVGLDLNHIGPDGLHLLAVAARHGHAVVVTALLKEGAAIDQAYNPLLKRPC